MEAPKEPKAYDADEIKAEMIRVLALEGFTVNDVKKATVHPRLVFADEQSIRLHRIDEHAHVWECVFRSVPSDGTYLIDPAYLEVKVKELAGIFRGVSGGKTALDGMTLLITYRVGDADFSTILFSTAFV